MHDNARIFDKIYCENKSNLQEKVYLRNSMFTVTAYSVSEMRECLPFVSTFSSIALYLLYIRIRWHKVFIWSLSLRKYHLPELAQSRTCANVQVTQKTLFSKFSIHIRRQRSDSELKNLRKMEVVSSIQWCLPKRISGPKCWCKCEVTTKSQLV